MNKNIEIKLISIIEIQWMKEWMNEWINEWFVTYENLKKSNLFDLSILVCDKIDRNVSLDN